MSHLPRRLFYILATIFTLFFNDVLSQVHPEVYERPMVLVITSYNNKEWYKKNLDSALSQNYSNFRVIYVDDHSPDGTGDLVEQYINENDWQDKVTLIKNTERKWKMENFYNAVHEFCRDQEIILDFDGDDFYPYENVLSIINEAYADPEVWITYGSYVMWPKPAHCVCAEVPECVVKKNAYRSHRWVTSQQRTFYAWLFKKIRKEDLKYNGKFVDMACDLAYMFPMLEMAGGRFKYITDVIYVYNRDNPISDGKKNFPRQLFLDKYIRGLQPYERLD